MDKETRAIEGYLAQCPVELVTVNVRKLLLTAAVPYAIINKSPCAQ